MYNGVKKKEDQVLKLSDSFDEKYQGVADIEVSVHMYNINYGYNDDLLQNCKPLKEYSWFVERIRYYKNEIIQSTSEEEMPIEIAVGKAVDDMPVDFEIKPFLMAHRAEVIGMLFMEYNEEETMRLVGKEKYEDGFKDGKNRGCNEAFRAMELIRSGVSSLNDLVESGISESIAKMALDQMVH